MLSNKTTTQVGQHAEDIALTYLQSNGLVFKAKNFHSRYGEIDLIMQDKDTYVFIEVKYRKMAGFGGSISAVSNQKQKKIKLSSSFYLQQSNLNEYNTPCRCDVVALQGELNNPEITWLKNAF